MYIYTCQLTRVQYRAAIAAEINRQTVRISFDLNT